MRDPPHSVDPVLRAVENGAFFETISEEVRRERLVRFIQATGKDAISSGTGTCAVCAGQIFT
jgi:hypothetical protein